MLKTKTVTANLPKASELRQRFDNITTVLSSRQLGWNGIVVEQYQYLSNEFEVEFPAPF